MPQSLAHSLAIKLKDARALVGLSTRDVANKISERFSISHATLANYEKARSTPNLEVLAILASIYDRPLTWFLESGPSLSGLRYRNLKSKVRALDLRQFELESQRWIEAYIKLERHLGEPLARIHQGFVVNPGDDGRTLASRLRTFLSLGDVDPIPSVADLLENFGIRTIEMPTEFSIDGMAAKFGEEHVVILNPTVPNDRGRMNAGHELGHVLFGDCEDEQSPESKEMETRAYDFSSHLLMPCSQLVEAFSGQSMVKLVKFKERFGISLAAMIYRAEKARIIPASLAKWLWIEFSKRGWRKEEPGCVRPDRATRFEHLLSSAVATNKLTWRDAASLMGVREDEINQRIEIALGSDKRDSEEEKGGGGTRDVIKFPG